MTSNWHDIECMIVSRRRLTGPSGKTFELQPGLLSGRMRATPLLIDGVLTARDAVCRLGTVFRADNGTLWMHSVAVGLINLWFPENTTLREPHSRDRVDIVLEGMLDTRDEYEFETDARDTVSGFLKYCGVKAFVAIERSVLAVDLEWMVLGRGKGQDSRLVRYGHCIPHDKFLFADSLRDYTEHRGMAGEKVFADLVQISCTPAECGDVARSSVIIEPAVDSNADDR